MSAKATKEVEMTTSGRRRIALLLAATASLMVLLGASAQAQGVTHEQLTAQGWTCFAPPPPAPNVIGCFNPGLGRPFPGNPDPPPSYSVLAFDGTSGEFLNTAHLIREDLYRGQPCVGGEPYRFIARIGYYECVRP
jgi:hypothetical protein